MMGGNVLEYVKKKKPNVDIIGLVGIFYVMEYRINLRSQAVGYHQWCLLPA
jgi:hypothetical protein